MSTVEQQEQVINLLAANEEAVEALYRVYAQRYPQEVDFWVQLADEERGHSALIRSLLQDVKGGNMVFDENRFSQKAIESSIKYVNDLAAEAQQTEYDIIRALSIAFDLEVGLLEAKFFEVFDTDYPALKKTLTMLSQSTQDHRDRTQRRLEEERAKRA